MAARQPAGQVSRGSVKVVALVLGFVDRIRDEPAFGVDDALLSPNAYRAYNVGRFRRPIAGRLLCCRSGVPKLAASRRECARWYRSRGGRSGNERCSKALATLSRSAVTRDDRHSRRSARHAIPKSRVVDDHLVCPRRERCLRSR